MDFDGDRGHEAKEPRRETFTWLCITSRKASLGHVFAECKLSDGGGTMFGHCDYNNPGKAIGPDEGTQLL